MLLVKRESNREESKEEVDNIKESTPVKDENELERQNIDKAETLNISELITKHKLSLWYNEKELGTIHIEWKETIKAIEENRDKKWNIESLEEIDKTLLKDMLEIVDKKIKEFTEKLKRDDLKQNEIDMIRIKYAIFRNKNIKYLLEELLDNQRELLNKCNENEISKIRRKFSDYRRAALRIGIIEKEEYQNYKINTDIIKSNSKPKSNKNGINPLIKINIGEEVTIKYGKDKFLVTKKQVKEISKYDENKIMEELKKGDFKIIDEEAIKECFDKEAIEPLVVYSIMKCKGIKSFEQAQILNKYFKDGLEIIEDVKFESRINITVDIKGLENSKIISKVKYNIVERTKKLADCNLMKIQEETKSNIWNKMYKK